jgi:hypothetical protein
MASKLTEGQIADLRRRIANPGPIATGEEVESFFARFKRKAKSKPKLKKHRKVGRRPS